MSLYYAQVSGGSRGATTVPRLHRLHVGIGSGMAVRSRNIGRQFPKIGKWKKKWNSVFSIKDIHCPPVLTFLNSPIEWLTFCQNLSTLFSAEKNWIFICLIPLFSGIANRPEPGSEPDLVIPTQLSNHGLTSHYFPTNDQSVPAWWKFQDLADHNPHQCVRARSHRTHKQIWHTSRFACKFTRPFDVAS